MADVNLENKIIDIIDIILEKIFPKQNTIGIVDMLQIHLSKIMEDGCAKTLKIIHMAYINLENKITDIIDTFLSINYLHGYTVNEKYIYMVTSWQIIKLFFMVDVNLENKIIDIVDIFR